MNDPGVLVPLIVIGGPIAYLILSRYLSYQERIEMIKRGIMPPPDRRLLRRMARGNWGQGVPPGAWQAPPVQPPAADPYFVYGHMQAQRQMRGGVIVTAIGVALTAGLFFINPDRPGPWLLGGLIPLFLGLAQVVLGVMSGATFGVPRPVGVENGQQQPANPRPDAQQASYTAEANAGPWGWRPGPAVGLERPAKPPDRP